MLTTWPLALGDHLPDRALRDVEEPGQVHGGDGGIVLGGVVGEGLADVDPRVVDQAVDPSEPVECLLDHTSGGVDVGDVTRHREKVGLVGGGDRPRGGDNGVSSMTECGRETGADSPIARR